MKAITSIEAPLARRVQPFNHEDIANVLFKKQSPTRIDTPFALSSIESLRLLPVAFSLSLFSDTTDVFEILTRVVYKDTSKASFITLEELKLMPPWCINFLLQCYTKHIEGWQKYFVDELESFCLEGISRFHWSVIQKAGTDEVFPRPLSVEQKIWISFQDKQIQSEQNAFIISLRDSLLPWLNPEAWQNLQERKEKTRTNEDYERQRQQMILGNFPTEVEEEDTTDWDTVT